MQQLHETQSTSAFAYSGILDQTLRFKSLSTPLLRQILSKTPIDSVPFLAAKQHGITTDVLRLDQLHSHLGGNKFIKLWGYLTEILTSSSLDSSVPKPVVSFGGSYSNHLYALAAAGKLFGFPTVGIVRGEQPKVPSATLEDIEAMGMHLVYISRRDYKRRSEVGFHRELEAQLNFGVNPYWIPEGGAGSKGQLGCHILGEFLNSLEKYTHIVMACGTGTTFAGVLSGVLAATNRVTNSQEVSKRPIHKHWLGISALRSDQEIIRTINNVLGRSRESPPWLLSNQFHHGGFAKMSSELASFMLNFYEQTAIPTDRVYTGKVFYALNQLLKQGGFAANSGILVVHTGGTQGNRD